MNGLRLRRMEVDGEEAPCASIHDAVVRQDRRSVAQLLQRQPDCVMARDEDDRTPLLLAAAAGDSSTCTLLVRRMGAYDADAINWPDSAGLTPLHWALTQQHYETAALLLRHAAATGIEDGDGRRPLHAAAFSGNARCVQLLLPHVAPEATDAASADGLVPLQCCSAAFRNDVESLAEMIHEDHAALRRSVGTRRLLHGGRYLLCSVISPKVQLAQDLPRGGRSVGSQADSEPPPLARVVLRRV